MKESLAQKSSLTTFANVIGAIIAYIGFFVIARYMPSGEQVIGLVGFSTSYLAVFLPVTKLGFSTAHTKKVSEGRDIGECNGAYLLITSILIVVMTVLVFASIALWSLLIKKGFSSPDELQSLWIIFGYTIITALSTVPVTTFNAKREVAKGQVGVFLGHVVRVSAIVFVVFSGLGALDIIWAYFLGGLASAAASFYYFRSYPVRWPSRKLLSEYRRFAGPLLIPSLLSPQPVSMAAVFVQLFWNLQQAGYYYSSYRIVSVFVVLGGSVAIVIFPKISELHSEGKSLEIISHAADAERLLAFVLSPVAVFMMVYASGVIHILLSNSFLGAVPTTIVLAIWLYIASISTVKSNLIPATDRPRLSGRIATVSALFSLALMIILIPPSLKGVKLFALSSLGAAIALTGGAVATFVLSNHYSNKLAGTRFEWRIILFPVLALISDIIVIPLTDVFPTLAWKWYTGLLFILLSSGIYLLISLLMRAVHREDIRLLLNALNPFSMHRYVADELADSGNGVRK